MSLTQLLKTYESKKKSNEKATQNIKKDIQRCIEDETISALKLQNHKVNNIHKNQQTIQLKLKKQQQLLSQFRKNQDLWKNLYQQLNRALMEAGDIVHYAGYVDAEMSQLLGEGSVAKYLEQAEKEQGVQEAALTLSDSKISNSLQASHPQQLSKTNIAANPNLQKNAQQ